MTAAGRPHDHSGKTRSPRLAGCFAGWAALPVLAAFLAVSGTARLAAGAWAGCHVAVVQAFLLARSKTVTWPLVAATFTVAVLAVPLVGGVSLLVGGAAGVAAGGTAGSTLVAGPVEETVKLAPLVVAAVWCPRRAHRFAAVDWLVLGVAAGAGFQAAEDGARRVLGALSRPGVLPPPTVPDRASTCTGLPRPGPYTALTIWSGKTTLNLDDELLRRASGGLRSEGRR